MGRRGMFSLCNFGSPYSWGVVASVIFSLKLASFVILLDSSKLYYEFMDFFSYRCGWAGF